MHSRARWCVTMTLCALLAGSGCERGQAANAAGEARAAAAPAPAVAAALGKPAPDFTLTDTEGQRHQLSQLRGKTVVLEWFNPDCPFVKHAHGKGPLVDMAKKYQGPTLVWLSINSGAQGHQGHGKQRNADARVEYAMQNPVLLDADGVVGHTYGALKTPHLFVIDANGVLVYRGGLDNAPIGVPDAERPRPPGVKEGELVPYLANALADLQAGKGVGMADTPPYGCSVKYAN
jgi:hypothetical protein